MASDEMVTLFKGGTEETTLPISKVNIPDLWHIAETIRSQGKVADGPGCCDLILNCWHIAGALKQHIEER
ncbi:unnamed protein product [marine sediment metagenome]|uniref:Uncharacterized protein n=1 Tax=marine sediment metagenome TaxID=412755 RepID=X1V0N3_9ZZZZ